MVRISYKKQPVGDILEKSHSELIFKVLRKKPEMETFFS